MVRMRGAPLTVALAVALGVGVPVADAAINAPPSQWQPLTGLTSGAVRGFALTPSLTQLWAATSGGVAESDNGGSSWSITLPGVDVRAVAHIDTTTLAAMPTGVQRSTSGSAFTATGLTRATSAVALVSGAAIAAVDGAGLWRSTDAGVTWTQLSSGVPPTDSFTSLTADVAGLLLASGPTGLYASTDAGATWARHTDGLPGPVVVARAASAQSWYASAGGGVWKTNDGGTTWSPLGAGLGALEVRDLQVSDSHLYAATENGLWVSHSDGKWTQATQQGLGPDQSLLAITPPVVPGLGVVGVIGGRPAAGAAYIGFEPADSTCLANNPDSSASCPVLSTSTPHEGTILTTTTGTFTGTPLRATAVQWQLCTLSDVSTCHDVAGAVGTSFTVPSGEAGHYVRSTVTVTSAAPAVAAVRHSIPRPVDANAAAYPGKQGTQAPAISSTTPTVGATLTVPDGTLPPPPASTSDGWFAPAAATKTWQWLRCTGTDRASCTAIAGSTQSSYTVTADDVRHTLRVVLHGTDGGSNGQDLSSAATNEIPAPAPSSTSAPTVVGPTLVGSQLVGSVGTWSDPTATFARSWLHCNPTGGACVAIPGAAGPLLTVTTALVGQTIRLRATATVGSLSTVLDSAPTAVVTEPSGPPPATDTTAPVISKAALKSKAFKATKGTTLSFTLSEAATVTTSITQARKGRLFGKVCKASTNTKHKRCTYTKLLSTSRKALAAGPTRRTMTPKSLKPGSYTLVLTAKDAAGNVSKKVTLRFTIKPTLTATSHRAA